MGPLEILLAVLGISALVIVHESGHYLAARAFKMRVLRYSIGIGPTLFRYKPKGSPTTFQVCAIPFLAYVQIAGMNPHEDVDPQDPAIYPNKSVFARIITIVAGPLANYLAASLMVFALAVTGWPQETPTKPMVVAQVTAGSPAAKAGIEPGDQVVEANGKPIGSVEDLIAVTAPRAGKPTAYVVKRNGKRLAPMTIAPADHAGRGIIGVSAKTKRTYVPMGVGAAAKASVVFPIKLTIAQLQGIADLVKHHSTEGLVGPVGMGKMVAEQAGKGPTEYLSILMLISVALGLFNLLPFPALDGGRLAFLGYELVTRRRPNERIETIVHTVGLLFLLGVIVLVTIRNVLHGGVG